MSVEKSSLVVDGLVKQGLFRFVRIHFGQFRDLPCQDFPLNVPSFQMDCLHVTSGSRTIFIIDRKGQMNEWRTCPLILTCLLSMSRSVIWNDPQCEKPVTRRM